LKQLLILLLFITCSISAQKITVIDAKTKLPIGNVSAYNTKKAKHCVSDINGVLDLSNYQDNEVIYFQHLAYDEFKINKQYLLKSQIVFLDPKPNILNEVFVSVSKKEIKRNRIAQEIATLSTQEIHKIAAQTSADLLSEVPGIKVQKSQFGGGSPVIRGMEANRILLVVDGVRLNNAIYRKGHLQNSISISPSMLERTEIVFGPSSVIYGSDALGGIIHYITKKPKISDITQFKPSFLTRFSSVNNEFTAQAGLEIQTKKWASFTNISHSKFGDLTMGKNRSHGFENWGLQTNYSNNSSSFYNPNSVISSDAEKQKNVGFKQLDLLQKIFIPLSKKAELNFNFQYSVSTDIPRFDRLTEKNGDELKFAEWYYGPQKRLLISSQLNLNSNIEWLKGGVITTAYQNIKESRIQRRFNSLQRSYRYEDVDVFSINGDFEIPLTKDNKRILSYGTEFTYNKVNSDSKGKTLIVNGNEITGFGENFNVQTRYADGGSSYISTALYTNYRQDLNKKQTLNTGIRLTNTHLKAKWIDNTFITLPDNKINLSNTAVTATIGYVYKPTKNWQLNYVISSGFRSPNIDDVGKVREKRGKVTVPNIDLKAEFAYNAEFGILKYFNDKKQHIGFSTYYTLLESYITREPFKLNGNSTIIFDGEQTDIIANVNKKTAYIIGGTFTYKGHFSKQFYAKSSLTYTKGKAYDTGENLSSIPPLFGALEIGYNKEKLDLSLNFKFNSRKKASDYNLIEGIDNIEQTPFITADNDYTYGNPAWQTLNFDLKYQFSKNMDFLFRIDNIFDQHYKEFSSSISAPGRNFSLSFISRF
jgi:hemoglobin/transferrin/lactoferrin receptor protein